MSREVRVVAHCDACEQAGRDTEVEPELAEVQVRLPGFEETQAVDLCENHLQRLTLVKLRELVEAVGRAVAESEEHATRLPRTVTKYKASSGDGPACPKCGNRLVGRAPMLHHLVNTHGVEDKVAASHLVPPPDGGVECPDCGMLCSKPGLGPHRAQGHRSGG